MAMDLTGSGWISVDDQRSPWQCLRRLLLLLDARKLQVASCRKPQATNIRRTDP
jgi:hypothetical protein